MRITIQVLIEDAPDRAPRAEAVGVIERDAEHAQASGLDLSLGESHQVLRQLQVVVLRE